MDPVANGPYPSAPTVRHGVSYFPRRGNYRGASTRFPTGLFLIAPQDLSTVTTDLDLFLGATKANIERCILNKQLTGINTQLEQAIVSVYDLTEDLLNSHWAAANEITKMENFSPEGDRCIRNARGALSTACESLKEAAGKIKDCAKLLRDVSSEKRSAYQVICGVAVGWCGGIIATVLGFILGVAAAIIQIKGSAGNGPLIAGLVITGLFLAGAGTLSIHDPDCIFSNWETTRASMMGVEKNVIALMDTMVYLDLYWSYLHDHGLPESFHLFAALTKMACSIKECRLLMVAIQKSFRIAMDREVIPLTIIEQESNTYARHAKLMAPCGDEGTSGGNENPELGIKRAFTSSDFKL